MTFERLECERLEELKDKENDIGTVREGLVAIDSRIGMNRLLRTPSHSFSISHFARAAAAHLHLHLATSPRSYPFSFIFFLDAECVNVMFEFQSDEVRYII